MSNEPQFFINENEPERSSNKKEPRPVWFWLLVLFSWSALNSGLIYLFDVTTSSDKKLVVIALVVYFIGFVPIVIKYYKSVNNSVDRFLK